MFGFAWPRILAAAGAIILFLSALLLLWHGGLPAEETDPEKIKAFEAYTLDGRIIRIHDKLKRPVIITFWATWCIPCRVEIPLLEKAYQHYQDEGLVVIGINAGGESWQTVTEWISEHEISFPIVLDIDRKLEVDYTIRGLPTTFFIDRNGKIQGVETGGFSEGDFKERLAEIGLKNTR